MHPYSTIKLSQDNADTIQKIILSDTKWSLLFPLWYVDLLSGFYLQVF